MRTLVDIGDAQIKALDEIAAAANVSRASLIRKAIGNFLDHSNREAGAEAFGLWGSRKADGVRYQDEIRSEW